MASPPRSPLREIEQIVLEFAPDSGSVEDASASARRRALALAAAAKPRMLAQRIARIGYAADMVAAVAPGLTGQPARLGDLIDRLDSSARISRYVLGREALRAPQLFGLPPARCLDVALTLVLGLTRARSAALWTRMPSGEIGVMTGVGDVQSMPDEAYDISAKLISGDTVVARGDGDLAGMPIHGAHGSLGVLVLFGDDVLAPKCRLLVEAAEPLLALGLAGHAVPPAASAASASGFGQPASPGSDGPHQDALTAAQKRLTRLRFDLHDGPQQDVLMLADDIRQFQDRLQELLQDHWAKDRLLGGLDDLQARLVALDGDLRRISVSTESPFLQAEALPDALTGIAKAFRARTDIELTLEMSGDLTRQTDSQQIALLALIREALSNVREHAQARHASVVVSSDEDGLTASIVDDGRGFDPESTLIEAARGGHLGLVSMHERLRMLGGRTEINSRPGGPTVISVTLPVYGGATTS